MATAVYITCSRIVYSENRHQSSPDFFFLYGAHGYVEKLQQPTTKFEAVTVREGCTGFRSFVRGAPAFFDRYSHSEKKDEIPTKPKREIR